MDVHLVKRITFILLLACELAEAAPPIAKPNCRGSCGHLQIPYPFGIGPDCYLDKWFEIVCKGTGGSAKAFLTSMDMEVRQINISSKPLNSHYSFAPTVHVQIPIIYSKFCQLTGNHSVTNFSEVLFTFLPLIIHSFRLVATTLQQ